MNTFLSKVVSSFSGLTRKKKLLLLLALLILLFGGYFLYQSFVSNNGYVFDTVKKTPITEVVSDSGSIISSGTLAVSSPTNGTIEALYVTNGETVIEDQKLFTVKSSATLQEQQAAFATYQAAVAALNAATTQQRTLRSAMYTSWKTYLDMATTSTYEQSKGVPNTEQRKSAEFQSTQENWLAAEKQFTDQEQAVAAAQSQVAAAWNAYQLTQSATVTAPTGGVVANLAISQGKSVTAATLLSPAKPALVLITGNGVEAVLQIGQTDIAKVEKDQKVTVHPDAYKDRIYSGKVIRVDEVGENILGVVTYNVYVELAKTDNFLKSGMTIDGDIVTKEATDALTVPNSAVVLYQGGKAVRILGRNNTITYVPVKTGIRGETRTEILEGVPEGQQIIVALTNEKAARPSFMGL